MLALEIYAFGPAKTAQKQKISVSGASAFHCRYNSYEASRVKEYSTIDISPMEHMDCKCIPL